MAFLLLAPSSRTWQEFVGTRSLAAVYTSRCMSTGPLQSCRVEKYWQVSSQGRVCNTRGRISYGCLEPSHYYRVKISSHHFYVHRIVAWAFRGPPPHELTWQVHHRDGNPSNNCLDNLEYVTQSENILASYANPLRRSSKVQQSIPVMWRAVGSQSWTTSPSMTRTAAELSMSKASVWHGCRRGKSVKGYEFQLADCGETATLEGEEWRQMYDPMSGLKVPGRMVSSAGRIKSKNGKISWGYLEKSGYCRTQIRLNSIVREERVHRLVAFAFLGPSVSKAYGCVNHKDLDKANNAAENLEYVTCSENVAHFYANTSRKFGMPVESRALDSNSGGWTKHASISSAARALDMSICSVSSCVNGHRVSACGYEFRSANVPAAEVPPGEDWRWVDFAALLREKDARKGA